jgi:hypothetical protein
LLNTFSILHVLGPASLGWLGDCGNIRMNVCGLIYSTPYRLTIADRAARLGRRTEDSEKSGRKFWRGQELKILSPIRGLVEFAKNCFGNRRRAGYRVVASTACAWSYAPPGFWGGGCGPRTARSARWVGGRNGARNAAIETQPGKPRNIMSKPTPPRHLSTLPFFCPNLPITRVPKNQ